jgi:hypothetical protein
MRTRKQEGIFFSLKVNLVGYPGPWCRYHQTPVTNIREFFIYDSTIRNDVKDRLPPLSLFFFCLDTFFGSAQNKKSRTTCLCRQAGPIGSARLSGQRHRVNSLSIVYSQIQKF